MCGYDDICPNGQGNAPSYDAPSQDQWVSYAPSDGGVKDLVQIGIQPNNGPYWTPFWTPVCTTLYQTHHASEDRATWEATGSPALQGSMPWRTYGYCCTPKPTRKY